MVQTVSQLYSFEEYLQYQDGTDNHYELVNGELKVMPPASGLHALILVFLYDALMAEIKRLNKKWKAMPGNVGVRTAENKSRIPDLLVLTEEQCREILRLDSAVLQSPPLLAVEIVSPGNAEDDYRFKRSEYAVREIPEYWIVDPQKGKVSVLELVAGFYEAREFTNNQVIISPTFPELALTVNQIINEPSTINH